MDVALLIILQDSEDAYSFVMIGREIGARVSGISHKPNKQIIDVFRADLTAIAQRANTVAHNGIAHEEFIELGELMYANFLPLRVRAWLSKANGGLAIITNEPSIPWEIMHDGTEFIGINRAIGRSLILGHAMEREPQARRDKNQREKLRALIIVDPTEDLPEARKEATILFSWLTQTMGDRVDTPKVLAGKEASIALVSRGLLHGYDIILYAGHIKVADSGQSCLCLSNGDLEIDGIHSALRGEPIVLLMGCRSAAVGVRPNASAQPQGAQFALPKEPSLAEHTRNMAEVFIVGGAKAVVGTLWEIPDEGAREFDKALFAKLIGERLPIGEAIRGAREEMRKSRPTDATWSSVVLYGDPNLTLASLTTPKSNTVNPSTIVLEEFVKAACVEARNSGSRSVTAVHLFLALTEGKGVLQSLLIERGVQNVAQFIAQARPPQAPLPPNIVPDLSNEVYVIEQVALVNSIVLGRPVTEEDVVHAFIQQGGGEVGRDLLKQGINLQQKPQDTLRPSVLKSENDLYEKTTLDLNRAYFCVGAWQALERAQRFAQNIGHSQLGTPHLLMGLMELPSSIIRDMLAQQNATVEEVQALVNSVLPIRGRKTEVELSYTYLSDNLREVLKMAVEGIQQDATAPDCIEERHLLLAIMMVGGAAAQIIAQAVRRNRESGG